MRNVALDLGAKKIAYCEVSDEKVVRRGAVPNLAALEELVGPRAEPARVAIEASREAWFVHDTLKRWGNDVVIVDTTRSRQLGIGRHGRKTDRIDAEVLARALARGAIPAAHVLSPHRRELRRQLNIRRLLVGTRSQYIVAMRGVARESGYKLPGCKPENFVRRVRATELPEDLKIILDPLLVTLELTSAQIADVEQKLEALCAEEPVIELLQTASGVGPIVAAGFVSVIDDAGRFRNAHQVESYLGLVPNESTTGGKQRLGSITKHGNSYMRALLVQAAWSVLRSTKRNDPLRLWGEAIQARRSKRVGAVAVARRLAGVLWAMWRNNLPYDPEKLAASSARGMHRAGDDTLRQAHDMSRRTQTKSRQQSRRADGTEVTTC